MSNFVQSHGFINSKLGSVLLFPDIAADLLIQILMITMTLPKGRSIVTILYIIVIFQTYLKILSMIKESLCAWRASGRPDFVRFYLYFDLLLNPVCNRRTISLMLKLWSWVSWFCRDDWKQFLLAPGVSFAIVTKSISGTKYKTFITS